MFLHKGVLGYWYSSLALALRRGEAVLRLSLLISKVRRCLF